MSNHFLINTRLLLAKISPISRIRGQVLRSQRKQALKRLNQEKVYILEIEMKKQNRELKRLNETWINLQKNLRSTLEKVKSTNVSKDEISTKDNFLNFVLKLNRTRNLETRIAALERVVGEFKKVPIIKVNSNKIHKRASLSLYQEILENYLGMLKTEVIYWKTQQELIEIKEKQISLA